MQRLRSQHLFVDGGLDHVHGVRQRLREWRGRVGMHADQQRDVPSGMTQNSLHDSLFVGSCYTLRVAMMLIVFDLTPRILVSRQTFVALSTTLTILHTPSTLGSQKVT